MLWMPCKRLRYNAKIGIGVSPVLKGCQQTLDLSWFKISPHSILYFKLLLVLIEFSSDDILINGVYYQIFEFTDGRCLEFVQ